MNDAPITPPDRKYAVFISYRHADNKEQGRQWATWLHHTLETYEVPPDLVGRTNLRGEPVPASLYPVFRDEEELPADADLSTNIQRALRHSALLVVLCSPRAVESRFVADEIKVFKELGKAGHILALMIDGEPNTTDDPGKARAGIRPEHECLPEPLRYGVPREDGGIDWTQRTEPVAADVRPENKPVQGWTTAAAYREELIRQGLAKPEIDRLTTAYEEQLQLATMKIIAGAIGLPLGEVTQRDKRHAEEKLKRARQELSRTEFLFAQQLLDLAERETGTARLEFRAKGYARLSRALENDPEHRAAAALSLEHLRRVADRGVLRVLAGRGAVFSPCGVFILSWKGNEVHRWDAASGVSLVESLRHGAYVFSAVFSPDGRRLVTTSGDKSAHVWDAASGIALTPPLRHDGEINSAVFSPDGRRILTSSEDKTFRIWDATSGAALVGRLCHERAVTCAVFSPNGNRVLTASEDKTARLWDAASGAALSEPLNHSDTVWSADFSPNGKMVLTASADQTARLWDAANGAVLTEFRHKAAVRTAAFSPDGHRILTASSDKTVQLWEAASAVPVCEPLRHEEVVQTAVFSPDGQRILTASDDRTARLWDAANGIPLSEPFWHHHEVNSAAFSPDGRRILTASRDKTVRLWDAASGAKLAEPIRHEGKVHSALFSLGGNRIVTASADKTARVWDATNGSQATKPARHEGVVRSAIFSRDGKRILTASDDRTAQLWNAMTGDPLEATLRHNREVDSAIFSPDEQHILTTSWDKTARLWDAASGAAIGKPILHEDRVRSAVFSPDGLSILTASGRFACIWRIARNGPIAHPIRHWDINSATFSPDGQRILTATEEQIARVWNAVTSAPVTEPLRHAAAVASAVFSPDGRKILTASSDHTACIWDAASGSRIVDPLQHAGMVWSAVFSPDGQRILTASWDKTARLWDTASGTPLAEPLRHEEPVDAAVFSPDGQQVLTMGGHMVRIWNAPSGELSTETITGGLLSRILEAAGGCQLSLHGLMEVVPLNNVTALRAQLDEANALDPLLRWWWSDPFTRTINPSSTITVPDYVRRRIREILDLEDEQAKPRCLQDARDAFLNHPLVLLCEAEQGQCSDPAWLRQHAVSRLLAEPHYLTPLEPPNAIGDAKANRQYELTLGLAEDCFLGARLLINDRTGQTRTTDPKRIELAKQVLARAMKLAPENEAYRKLAAELGF